MLSKKSKYAIKALIALAEHGREEPVRIADLARAQQIPPKFLELILLFLRIRFQIIHLRHRRRRRTSRHKPAAVDHHIERRILCRRVWRRARH